MGKLNCPNCGAPITGIQCEYCGTMFYDFAEISEDKPKFLLISFHGKRMWCRAQMFEADLTFKHDELPELVVSFVLCPDNKGNMLYQEERTE